MVKKIDKSGHCKQVFMTYETRFKWQLVTVGRGLLFGGSFSTKIALWDLGRLL